MKPLFKRSLLLLGCLAMALHVASVSAADTPVRPKGLRVLFDGNSWFNFVPGVVAEMAKAAEINGHKEVKPAKPNDFQDQLGEVDVYAHGIHWWWHDEWLKRVEQSAETGLKANPDFRAYCHAAWVVHDIRIDDAKIKTVDDYNNADLDKVQAEIDKYRKLAEAAADKMNGKFGKRVVFVVPVGDATVKLRRMVVAGKFPGVTKQSELWSDVMPHPGRQVRALSGYCHFAAIYRTSPVGLQNNNFYLRADDPLPITAEQHAILQKIAWDVVSAYPYAGIAPEPKSKWKALPDKKDDPKPADPRPVPEQLKGWKGTNELPDGPVRPKGLTILFYGNSWFNFVPDGVADQVKAAGIAGHKEVRMTKSNEVGVLETGEIEVYANGVHWWASDPWTQGLTAEKLVEKGLKANPNFRAYFHAAWLVWDGRAQATKIPADFDSSQPGDVQAALDKTRKGVEAIVDKLNEKFGKRVVFLVPVGDATAKLRELILQGKYPGVKKQSELWTDGMPHPGADVKALSTYCHFAAIYRTSPVGLKIARYKELSDEQHAILQKIAWDVVSAYPYAGIALEPKGKSKASPDKKDDPKSTDPRPVPEQLKGWKGTNELPDGSIVADYNDYIEKLPKAERTGVANVNYYVDSNGRSAVAVLVNVDRVEWAHLLTYDKQNKRAGVTKFVVTK